ncbi:hypothetical protein HYV84_02065, partial [Candidatus Woesearchaeota archaeon]|nr:hypothetical protein [Candidatus Woesearchaeota archaeon]
MSTDQNGKPFSDTETTTFRIKAIDVYHAQCLKPAALEKVDCTAIITAKKDDLSKALIQKESGPGISPVEPIGACSYGNDKKYKCAFSFIPEKMGKYNLEFVAETKSVNPSDGKPYSDKRGVSLNLNPFELRDITCSHNIVGEEAKCSSEAYIKKEELSKAEFKITSGGKFEPAPLVTDCKWEEYYTSYYSCTTKFKANDPGKYTVEFSVETKPDASGNSKFSKV